MTKYTILAGIVPSEAGFSAALRSLEEQVEAHLKKGWKLQGGLSTMVNNRGSLCYATQAMIKEEDENEQGKANH